MDRSECIIGDITIFGLEITTVSIHPGEESHQIIDSGEEPIMLIGNSVRDMEDGTLYDTEIQES